MSGVTVRNGFAALTARLDAAIDAGLIAAAQVIVNRAKENVRGEVFAVPESPRHHVTGNLQGSITRTDPTTDGRVHSLKVGTNVDYGLFWEVGWRPAFGHYETSGEMRKLVQHIGPRRFLRHEWLRPAGQDTTAAQAAAFRRVAVGVLTGQPVSEAAD